MLQYKRTKVENNKMIVAICVNTRFSRCGSKKKEKAKEKMTAEQKEKQKDEESEIKMEKENQKKKQPHYINIQNRQ